MCVWGGGVTLTFITCEQMAVLSQTMRQRQYWGTGTFKKTLFCVKKGNVPISNVGGVILCEGSRKLQWLFCREAVVAYCVLIVPFGTNIFIHPYH